jgi:hypothetical protein
VLIAGFSLVLVLYRVAAYIGQYLLLRDEVGVAGVFALPFLLYRLEELKDPFSQVDTAVD